MPRGGRLLPALILAAVAVAGTGAVSAPPSVAATPEALPDAEADPARSAAAPLEAAPPIAQGVPSSLPPRPTAYLVTVGPGDAVWERFGHNLLWIHDPAAETGEAYNYGLFSFEQENFILRFVRGEMRYWMAGIDVGRQLEAYRAQNRTIDIQELALDTAEVRELQGFLEWNERPENRFYRYDYYRDNCSTRVRDALDRVLGGRLESWARERVPGATYRDHTLRLTAGLFWVSVGMHFGLGPSVDRPLDAWEAMFVPMEMRDHVREFAVPGPEGGERSLVRSEWRYYDAGRPPVPAETPRWIVPFAAAGLLAGALLVGLGAAGRASGREDGRTFLSVAIPWLAGVGLAGTLVAFLWGFTDHVDTHWNVNLFHANPLHLALAFVLIPGLGGRRPGRSARLLGVTLAALSVLGVLAGVLPAVDQTNAEFVALLLPANLALGWSVVRLTRRPSDPTDPSSP